MAEALPSPEPQSRPTPGARTDVLDRIRGGVIISSQVMDPRSPLDDPETLAALAQTAVLGGAVGARVASAETAAALRRR
jgi:N-acylglucosamine-6-phosphate 2-epimerase